MIALSSALWFLPVCLPIAIWVAWSDMKFMKIHNKAVIAMAVAYAVVGLLAFPLQAWLWGWAVLGIVLMLAVATLPFLLFGR